MTQAARLRGYLLATGLAMSCLASTGAAAAPSQTWERHNAAGLAALETRHFTEARQRFAVALREAERQGPETESVAITLDNQARLLTARGDFAKAETRLRRSLAIRQKLLGADDPKLATTLGRLGALAVQRHRLDQAERLLTPALASLERVLDAGDPRLAAARNALGTATSANTISPGRLDGSSGWSWC